MTTLTLGKVECGHLDERSRGGSRIIGGGGGVGSGS